MDRPHWTSHFLKIATVVSERCGCASGRKVGSILVKDNRILSSGYNSPPSRYPELETCVRRERNVPSGEQLHLCPCNHSEINAICNAAKHGVSLEGATCYTTTGPCATCMGAMVNAGIVKVVYMSDYSGPTAEMAKQIAMYADIPLVLHSTIIDGEVAR